MSSTPKTIQIVLPSGVPHGIRTTAGRLPSPSLRVIPIRLVSHHRSSYASSTGGVRDAQRQRPQVPSHRVGTQTQTESPSGKPVSEACFQGWIATAVQMPLRQWPSLQGEGSNGPADVARIAVQGEGQRSGCEEVLGEGGADAVGAWVGR